MKTLFWTEPYADIKKLQSVFLGRQCSFIADSVVDPRFIRKLEDAGFQKLTLPVGLPQQSVFERSYIELISELSAEYKSLQWWASTLSEKNEHSSPLYRNLYFYYVIASSLETLSQQELLVIADRFMARQLSVFCRARRIRFVGCSHSIKRFASVVLDTTLPLYRSLVFIAEGFRRKLLVSILLGAKIRQALQQTSGKKRYVIRSFIDERIGRYDSFKFNPFFGSLPMHAAKRGYSVIILAGIMSGFDRVVSILQHSRTVTIIPEEYILGWSDFPAALWQVWRNRVIIKQPVIFLGFDVTWLVNEELNRSLTSLASCRNYLMYRLGLRFGKMASFDVYIQTFENYAWEKMLLLGLRAAGSRAILLGFQHAFVSRSSFKYFLGMAERNLVPLPDRIITLGSRTKTVLEERGNYPLNRLVVGCALRQEYLHHQPRLNRCRQKRLAVPLTMVSEECRKIVRFVLASGLTADWQVNFRCHPSLPRSAFDTGLEGIVAPGISFDNALPVLDELARSAVLAYTWTTVALEALYMGVPVVHLDILQPLRVDPLFECADLKRTACVPADLAFAAREFYDMNDIVFENERKSARSYLEEYFYPVTEENLRYFFEGHP